MGWIWEARDESLDTPCVVKFIRDDYKDDPEIRARFEREAKAAAQLRSPHVVTVLDYGSWQDIQYIAMERLEGEDLCQRLERVGWLSPEETFSIIDQVGRALALAHAAGIVHRDLKPENIFLVRVGEGEEIAKVLDFGIAKYDCRNSLGVTTEVGLFLGSPWYVSPEQASAEDVDWRTDLWSLAVVTFQSLTGQLPFHAESISSVFYQLLHGDMPMPTAVCPDIAPAFDAWWAKATRRDREQRFQSAQEMVDALAHALSFDTEESPVKPGAGITQAGGFSDSDHALGRRRESSPAVERVDAVARRIQRYPVRWLAALALTSAGLGYAVVANERHASLGDLMLGSWSEEIVEPAARMLRLEPELQNDPLENSRAAQPSEPPVCTLLVLPPPPPPTCSPKPAEMSRSRRDPSAATLGKRSLARPSPVGPRAPKRAKTSSPPFELPEDADYGI